MITVIKNIKEIVQVEHTIRKWVAGKDMARLETIKNGFIEIKDGIISNFGSMEDWLLILGLMNLIKQSFFLQHHLNMN